MASNSTETRWEVARRIEDRYRWRIWDTLGVVLLVVFGVGLIVLAILTNGAL